MRGRRPRQESRETEIRARLAEWKGTPEFARPSLRALARKLGTSHQLLRHYLKRWDQWQGQEYLRQAREIRACAKAENRSLTPWEEQQAHACDRAGVSAFVHSLLLDDIKRMKQDSVRRPLVWQEIKALKIFAPHFPEAQELLGKCSQEGPKERKRFTEIVKETPRQEDETYIGWVRRIWDQCAKYDTKCPAVITEEHLQKCSQGSAKNRENNLPVIPRSATKSFNYV